MKSAEGREANFETYVYFSHQNFIGINYRKWGFIATGVYSAKTPFSKSRIYTNLRSMSPTGDAFDGRVLCHRIACGSQPVALE